jgi:hypothetical protein
VAITGTPGSVTASLANGSITAVGSDATITPFHTNAATSSTVAAIVVPHAAKAGRTITFTLGGKVSTYDIPDNIALQSGKRYNLTFDVTEAGVEPTFVSFGATINQWEDEDFPNGGEEPTEPEQPEPEPAPEEPEGPTYAAASNAYIVAPNTEIYIPVSRANEHVTDAIGEGDELSAEFLWADAPLLLQELAVYGTGATGAIKVKASGSESGNAVIAVKVGDDIKWSWHIWVTSYVPSGAWLDRNLGATSGTATDGAATFGLYYQWGRKDPFPSAAALSGGERTIYTSIDDATGATYNIADNKVTAAQTIDYTILNPKTFIGVNGSWQTGSTTDDNNWGATGSKTIYDPCPAGYRVPVNGTWAAGDFSAWDATNKGRTAADKGGWYPASGSRSFAAGAVSYVGSSGFVWYATPASNANGYFLDFAASKVSPSGNALRAFGLPVRCLLEE